MLCDSSKKVTIAHDPLDLMIVSDQNITFWDLDAPESELFQTFCSSLLRLSLPTKENLTSGALITKSNHNLTWLDLETLNISPSAVATGGQMAVLLRTTVCALPFWLTQITVFGTSRNCKTTTNDGKRSNYRQVGVLRGRLLGNHNDFHWQLGGQINHQPCSYKAARVIRCTELDSAVSSF